MKNFIIEKPKGVDQSLEDQILKALEVCFGEEVSNTARARNVSNKAAEVFNRRQSRGVMISKQFSCCSSELCDAMINAQIRSALSDINNSKVEDERAKNVLLITNIMNGYRFSIAGPVEAKRICETYVGIAAPTPLVKG